MLDRSTKLIKKLQRNRKFRRLSKWSETPVNCPQCFVQISRASNLKRHLDCCKITKVRNLLRSKIDASNSQTKTDINKQTTNVTNTDVTDMGKNADKPDNIQTDSAVNNVSEEPEQKLASKRISRTSTRKSTSCTKCYGCC